MAIKNIQTVQTGLVGVLPSLAYIYTSDTEATVLTTGYLNAAVEQGTQFSMPCIAAVSTMATPTSQPTVGWYQISHVGTNWSLVSPASPGEVTLPTIANHIVVSLDTVGTLGNFAGKIIQAGDVQAGLSGTQGRFVAFSSTPTTGSFLFVATANLGNTPTSLTNAAMGQASAITIPDPVNAVGQLLIGATATPFISGNFPVASGTAGLMVDSGVAAAQLMKLNAVNTLTGSGQIILQKATGTEAANAVTASGNAGVITTSSLTTAAGASYAITWTNTKITATSAIALCIQGGTNTVNSVQFKCIPGTGSATLTIYNVGPTDPLNGTMLIGYSVL